MGSLTLMEDELFRAAVRGDKTVLREASIALNGGAYYTDQTAPGSDNIIHVAAEHGRAEFIEEALARFPMLGRRKNDNMETPLHVAARMGYEDIVKLLVSYETQSSEDLPWMACDKQGDTPLHLALTSNKLKVALDLLHIGSTAPLSLLNSSKETPLHIFLKHFTDRHTTMDALLNEGVLSFQGVYMRSQRSSASSASMEDKVFKELLKYKPATCMRNAGGLTPLLIASQRGSLSAIDLILEHSPQSSKVCDLEGKTVLHHMKSHSSPPRNITYYEQLKELLRRPEIDAIKDATDSHGNTPLHLALQNTDLILVRVLYECFADFGIKNKDGVSPLDLINSFPDFISKMEEVTLTHRVFSPLMDEKLLKAAKEGDVSLFEDVETDIESGKVTNSNVDGYFMRKTSQGHSILHVAVRHGHINFIEKAIQHFPTLVLTADLSGETPLHVGARLKKDHHPIATTLLQLTKECVEKFKTEVGSLFLDALPWRQKNSKGDTPLHEALRSSNYDMATYLLEFYSELSSFENNAGESPLHILARYSTYRKSDKIGALVKLLIVQNESAVHKRDSNGFTPLLRAAYCGRVRVAFWIIRHCPASVQFRDPKGRNFLHLLRLEPTAELDAITTEDMLYMYTNILVLTSNVECDASRGASMIMPAVDKYKEFRKLTGAEFDVLRRSQDNDGNTPLHYALKNENLGTAKFLLHWCLKAEERQEMNIINNEGHSIFNLLELLADNAPYKWEVKELASVAEKKIKEEAFGKRIMDSEVYVEAVKGNSDYFFGKKEENEDPNKKKVWCEIAADGSNILHLAFQHRRIKFATKVMKCHPHLLLERNFNGDTPLHNFASLWDGENVQLHKVFVEKWEELCKNENEYSEEGVLIVPPWRVKNSQGNCPLHEAFTSCNYFDGPIFEFDSEVITYINYVGKTPYHLCDMPFSFLRADLESRKNVIKAASSMQDREGLTPLLTFAKSLKLYNTREILDLSPESIQLRDYRGRSLFHFLRIDDKVDVDELERLEKLKNKLIYAYYCTRDFDGNTPLHLAIQDGNSFLAKALAKMLSQRDGTAQLYIQNNEGKSVLDLLRSHDDAPNEVLPLLLKKQASPEVFERYKKHDELLPRSRSRYGIHKSQVKEMTNTLSVVAGLLATMTFAATFQVPGGYDGGSGKPILLQEVAFKVFMISNSFAMCGSMIVLFSLLWVMVIDSVTESFVMLDMSITILQLSFAATLLSFMMAGYVYISVSHKAIWLGVFICTLCSIAIFLMRKVFVLYITRFFRGTVYFLIYCKARFARILAKIFPCLGWEYQQDYWFD